MALVSALLLLLLLPLAMGARSVSVTANVPVHFALILEGSMAGWIQSVEGGHVTADVVVEKLGGDWLQKKHIGNAKYEEITITFGMGMSKGLYDWIRSSFDRQYSSKSGSIVAVGVDGHAIWRLDFTNALITELGMPALDAASKDAAYMTLKFSPETTRKVVSGGGKLSGSTFKPKKQKQWLPSNFRLRIDGLEEPLTRVNKIEALVIKQKVTENAVGALRDYEQEPASVEVPNLVITLAESHSKPLYDWHEDFVIRGNHSEDQEKGGSLEYLAPNGEVLFSLRLAQLGIFRLSADRAEAQSDRLRMVKVEMYCEDIQFDYQASWATFPSAAVPGAAGNG